MTTNDLFHSARLALVEFGFRHARVRTLDRERNAVFRVNTTDGRRFILRLRSPERFNDAAAGVQLRWLERLGRQTTVGAPIPLRTQNGRRFTHVQVGAEQWRATCLTRVDGRSPRGPSFLRPRVLRAIGHAIGQMHANAETFRPAALKACPQLDASYFFGPQTAAGAAGRAYLSTADHDRVRRAADRIRRAMRRVSDSPAHVGIIHGDLEPPNWVIASGVPRPIDFDEFGVGRYAFDLMQIIWSHALWKDYPRFQADLLAGYEAVRPLSSSDRNALDLYQAIPFIVWLNRGSKEAAQSEFRQWLAPTIRRISELCGA